MPEIIVADLYLSEWEMHLGKGGNLSIPKIVNMVKTLGKNPNMEKLRQFMIPGENSDYCDQHFTLVYDPQGRYYVANGSNRGIAMTLARVQTIPRSLCKILDDDLSLANVKSLAEAFTQRLYAVKTLGEFAQKYMSPAFL